MFKTILFQVLKKNIKIPNNMATSPHSPHTHARTHARSRLRGGGGASPRGRIKAVAWQ